ncbi:MAG: FAD-binding protein [Sphingobacteriales bacterium]|nr:MAG: FAD-binding protein [Sphingobacteriales bacterium]
MLRPVTEADLHFFETVLPPDRILTDAENRQRCAADQTEDFRFLPEVVLQPISPEEISTILRYCHEHRIPVTPRGAGTGLSGGALPVQAGVVLDLQRMNRILDIDVENFQVTTEPGVITQVLQEAVAAHGLFYPPDPASKGSCFIGGNVSENSGGPRALKYGVVKDYVLNLEVVLPTGEILWTGANTLKNATGYNLTGLLVGSEGTLAVITKIVLRLIPAVRHTLTLLAPFGSATDACRAVNGIFLAGFSPCALEFMERDALDWALQYTGATMVLPDAVSAHLLVELDGNHPEQLLQDAEAIALLLEEQFGAQEVLLATDAAQKETLWQLRRKVGEAVKSHSVYKEEDTVVPRARLPLLLQKVKELGRQFGFKSVCYGHAGDGNLHVNIVKASMSDADWQETLPQAITLLFEEVVRLGGTISGEHGIGYSQKNYLPLAFSEAALTLQKRLKTVFDPHNILNPDKIFIENEPKMA